MHLRPVILRLFSQLSDLLEQLSEEEYSMPVTALSGATIGQHFRHVLECFQELEQGYHGGEVNYDLRRRDYRLETSRAFALRQITFAGSHLEKADKPLRLHATVDEGVQVSLPSSYYRELMHNLDHAVHHMAMIRIGLQAFPDIQLPDSFGIAYATLKFKGQSHS